MEILKEKTRSICPKCFQELDARVVRDGKEVFLEKECPEHGGFRFLIEKDAEFYNRIMHKEFVKDRVAFEKLALPVTYQCNLNCQVCYAPDRKQKDFSLEELRAVIQDFKGRMIKLTGGEATLNANLPFLIEIAKESGKKYSIVTNGVKLADASYVKMLKKAGLEHVAVAFCGFSDDVCEKIYGDRILKEKLRALKNLKKSGITVSLSVTLVRGVNEKELAKIYRYYLKNRPFIKLLRIRSLSYIGQYVETTPFCLSELIELLSKVTGFDKDELVEPYFERPLDHSSGYSCTATCRFRVNLFKSFDYRFNKKIIKNQVLRKIRFVIDSLYFFGIINTLEFIIKKIMSRELSLDACIEIRTWPDKQRLDLGEMQWCLTAISTKDKSLLPFCYAIIMDENNYKK